MLTGSDNQPRLTLIAGVHIIGSTLHLKLADWELAHSSKWAIVEDILWVLLLTFPSLILSCVGILWVLDPDLPS